VSKERARRRAERQHEAAMKAAARQRETERRARAQARRRALTGWIPQARFQPGLLAARRRAELAATFGLLFLLNLLVWLLRPDWAARLGALVVSAVVFPVVRLVMQRR
jgi:Flp pilus assembly protein TadB